MKYYLETNALYSIAKITKKRNYLFTSVLSLYEIVSGINCENYEKRKNILIKIMSSSIHFDWDMPEKIIFDSFDVTINFEFCEKRIESLKNLINRIILSNKYDEFINSYEFKEQKYNFDYFKKLDNLWSKGFINGTIIGYKSIKEAINKGNSSFRFNEKEFILTGIKDLNMFFEKEKNLNQSMTIFGLIKMIQTNCIDLTEEEIYNSYNGLIDNYINGFTEFCSYKMSMLELPAKNDFTDLTHLLYLRNYDNCMIVSNDKIFDNCFKRKSIKIEYLEK